MGERLLAAHVILQKQRMRLEPIEIIGSNIGMNKIIAGYVGSFLSFNLFLLTFKIPIMILFASL